MTWHPRQALFLLPTLSALSALSCAKFVIADRAKKEPAPAPALAPTRRNDAGTGVTPVPPPERIIRLTVAQVQPEAWWNTCMFLKVNDEPKEFEVGCGKSAAQMGKVIELPAKKDFCNVLKVRMKVTTGCPPTHTCEAKSWERGSGVDADKKYFKFVEATKILPLDAAIVPEATMKAGLETLKKDAEAHVAKAGNTWLRVWFEDQTEENFSSWTKDKSKWEEFGVDYNDYVIDLKGEAVDFTLEGSGLPCGNNGAAAAAAAPSTGTGTGTAPAAGTTGTTGTTGAPPR